MTMNSAESRATQFAATIGKSLRLEPGGEWLSPMISNMMSSWIFYGGDENAWNVVMVMWELRLGV